MRTPGLEVRLARDAGDVDAALRLRYQVFAREMGGAKASADHAMQMERDSFDDLADHLILVDPARGEDHVVGAYRLLRGDRLAPGQGFSSEVEYDLTALRGGGRRLLELGRSCLHPDYRGGTAMLQLWAGLADYSAERGFDVLFGVASFPGTDVAALAGPLAWLHRNHLAPPHLRAQSRAPVGLDDGRVVERKAAMLATPALLKAYLRLGGFIGEGAFVDRDFNTVDVFVVLETARIPLKQKGLVARGRGSDD